MSLTKAGSAMWHCSQEFDLGGEPAQSLSLGSEASPSTALSALIALFQTVLAEVWLHVTREPVHLARDTWSSPSGLSSSRPGEGWWSDRPTTPISECHSPAWWLEACRLSLKGGTRPRVAHADTWG